MDTKSNFYLQFELKNSEFNKKSDNGKVFICYNYKRAKPKPKVTKHVDKILELYNINTEHKHTYHYLLGWESAKILLPKICINYIYSVKICIANQDKDFILGFAKYKSIYFEQYDVRYYLDIYYSAENIVVDSIKIGKINIISRESDKVNHTEKFDGVINNDFSHIGFLHEKCQYLVIQHREQIDMQAIYCSFIMKYVTLIDIPILPFIIFVCNTLQNKSRISYKNSWPLSISEYKLNHYYSMCEHMELESIIKIINERSQQLVKIDYVSKWSELNPMFYENANDSSFIIDDDRVETGQPDQNYQHD